jgi:hypothetical protein
VTAWARLLVERIIGCVDYFTTDVRASDGRPRYKWYPEMWANVSPLMLLDPRMPAVRMAAPDLRFRRPGQQPDQHEKLIRPASGRIVIFPAWLSHAVRPYRGQGSRVSIAVNLSAVPVSISPEGQARPA